MVGSVFLTDPWSSFIQNGWERHQFGISIDSLHSTNVKHLLGLGTELSMGPVRNVTSCLFKRSYIPTLVNGAKEIKENTYSSFF